MRKIPQMCSCRKDFIMDVTGDFSSLLLTWFQGAFWLFLNGQYLPGSSGKKNNSNSAAVTKSSWLSDFLKKRELPTYLLNQMPEEKQQCFAFKLKSHHFPSGHQVVFIVRWFLIFQILSNSMIFLKLKYNYCCNPWNSNWIECFKKINKPPCFFIKMQNSNYFLGLLIWKTELKVATRLLPVVLIFTVKTTTIKKKTNFRCFMKTGEGTGKKHFTHTGSNKGGKPVSMLVVMVVNWSDPPTL